MVPLQVCAEWAEIVNCRAHPRILLPQNRCLPEPLAAPFPRQPEPRCNTLDFASKVVCQRDASAPLETQEKRPSTALLVLGQCADPLAHGLDQRNNERISHHEIAHPFRHPGCSVIRKAVEPFAFDGSYSVISLYCEMPLFSSFPKVVQMKSYEIPSNLNFM